MPRYNKRAKGKAIKPEAIQNGASPEAQNTELNNPESLENNNNVQEEKHEVLDSLYVL